jgi:hypothetical protein
MCCIVSSEETGYGVDVLWKLWCFGRRILCLDAVQCTSDEAECHNLLVAPASSYPTNLPPTFETIPLSEVNFA